MGLVKHSRALGAFAAVVSSQLFIVQCWACAGSYGCIGDEQDELCVGPSFLCEDDCTMGGAPCQPSTEFILYGDPTICIQDFYIADQYCEYRGKLRCSSTQQCGSTGVLIGFVCVTWQCAYGSGDDVCEECGLVGPLIIQRRDSWKCVPWC